MGIPDPILFWVVGAQSLCTAHSTRGQGFVGLINYLVKVFMKEVIRSLLLGTSSCLLGLWGWGMLSRPVPFLPKDREEKVMEYEERFLKGPSHLCQHVF